MFYRIAADAMVVLHAAYAGFVVFGLVAILLGIVLRWGWVRNFWFRLLHLLMIGLVVAETAFGIDCPLTVWENDLRRLGGERGDEQDFIARWVHELLFYDAPQWVFSAIYIAFGLLVLATFVLAPPRWPGRKD